MSERTIDWDGGAIRTIDQAALPDAYRVLRLTTVADLLDAIDRLAIRGAPALGAAGALGVALSARLHTAGNVLDEAAVRADADRIAHARPTAVNLAWGAGRALSRLPQGADAVLAEAMLVLEEDERVNARLVERTADYVEATCTRRPLSVLTHCHTGRLATVSGGTALGAIGVLADRKQLGEVLVDETRPLLQGSRLTSWELADAGIRYRVCVDSAGPTAIARGLIDCVMVGADRIAANGDVANKIGTYPLALAAHRAGIPMLVVAPESTWDASLATGSQIVIEERSAEEVTHVRGRMISPAGSAAYNPAFDVTPAELITAIVTENRVFRPAGR